MIKNFDADKMVTVRKDAAGVAYVTVDLGEDCGLVTFRADAEGDVIAFHMKNLLRMIVQQTWIEVLRDAATTCAERGEELDKGNALDKHRAAESKYFAELFGGLAEIVDKKQDVKP